MEVILLERVEKLGQIGDVVTIKDGYARNYLIPQEKALRATKENKQAFEAQRKEIEKKNEARKQEAEKIFKKTDHEVVTLIRSAGDDGRLYGSVTARDIAAEVAKKSSEVTYKNIQLSEPIKYTGIYEVRVVLHPEVIATVRANVARTEGEAKEALTAKKSSKKDAATDAEAPTKTEDAAEPAAEAANDSEAA